jgi:prepilin-type N-terminal cleavage/methylation domain-containing protein
MTYRAPCASVARHFRRASRGFTLLEMLVTLVIVALVAAILAQALAQVSRIERLMDGGSLRSASAAVRIEWVRTALESLQPGVLNIEHFRGSARELQGLSSAVPMLPTVGSARLHLRLVASSDRSQTHLVLQPEGPDAEPVVLHSWVGNEGRFVYLDTAGVWLEQWPVAATAGVSGPATSSLPRAVALQTGDPAWVTLVAAPRVSALPQPSRRQLEAL